MKRLILLFLLVLSQVAYSQQLTKELIIPNKYERNTANNTYMNLLSENKFISIDDSTLLMVALFSDKYQENIPEKRHPVLYKIRNTKDGFKILWQSKPYLDTSFTAYFGDLVVEDGKFKAVFLYQKTIITKNPSSIIYYPFFLDIDPETGNIIDSVGYLGDFKSDANKPNSMICDVPLYHDFPYMKYDGIDLIIPVEQAVHDSTLLLIKNISRKGVINKIEQTEDHPLFKPDIFFDNNNNRYQYDQFSCWGTKHVIYHYINNKLSWSDTLCNTPDDTNSHPIGLLKTGSGFFGNTLQIFINQRDLTNNINKIYVGIYNSIGRIKLDTLNLIDINFYPVFATLDENGTYYFSGKYNSLYPLNSFQVEQYKNTQKKSLVWNKDSSYKFISQVHTLNNNKVLACGMNVNTKKQIYSIYLAEIDFSKPNGLEEKTENLNLGVSPNPAEDYITVTLKPSEGFEPSEGSEINIYNTLGEKVMSESARHAVPLRINISNLPKGMYFVKIGSETTKFVKL